MEQVLDLWNRCDMHDLSFCCLSHFVEQGANERTNERGAFVDAAAGILQLTARVRCSEFDPSR